jgi:long-chain-fatty-acid--CoA ligase ACSBG
MENEDNAAKLEQEDIQPTSEAPVTEVCTPQETQPTRVKFRSTNPDDGPDIAMGQSGLSSEEPITIGKMFKLTVSKVPDRPALKYKIGDTWNEYTFQQYYDLSVAAAKSFLKLDLRPFHAVAIIGFNACEWHISCLGSIFAGGLACGIYATNNAEACKYIAEDCKVSVAVVEDQKQLDKFLEIRDDLPDLTAIVQYKGELSQEYPNVYDVCTYYFSFTCVYSVFLYSGKHLLNWEKILTQV